METSRNLDHFLCIPWCASVIGDVNNLAYVFPTEANFKIDQFHTKRLKGEDALRSFLVFSHRQTPAEYDANAGIFKIRKLSVLADVGIEVSGFPGVSHGGFTAFLFDMAGGWLGQCNVQQAIEDKILPPKSGSMTKKLEIEYLAPVLIPGVLLLHSRIEKVNGRNLEISITLEDQRRTLLCRGKLFSVIVSKASKI